MKFLLFFPIMLLFWGQNTATKTPPIGSNATNRITFTSVAPLETIVSTCNAVTSTFNKKTGGLSVRVAVAQFEFDRPLMKKHFMENYLETSQYANATFEGFATDMSRVDFDKKGEYPVRGIGYMNLHGVRRDIQAVGTIIVESPGVAHLQASYEILLNDYKIARPSFAVANIAEKIQVEMVLNL